MAVLGHDQLGYVGGGLVRLFWQALHLPALLGSVIVIPIEEKHHVRILFYSTRISEVRQHRPLVGPGFTVAAELGWGQSPGSSVLLP